MCYHHGIGEKMEAYSYDSGHLLLFIIVNPWEAGAFSMDFTLILAAHCRAFSRAWKIEILKALLFCGPEGRWMQMTGALWHMPTVKAQTGLSIHAISPKLSLLKYKSKDVY